MIRLTSILKELEFGFGMGTTSPDYEDVPVKISINDGLQIRKPAVVKGEAHVGKMPGTDLPIIVIRVHKLAGRQDLKIAWNPSLKRFTLLGNDRAIIEPEDDASLDMFLKLRKKREKTNV